MPARRLLQRPCQLRSRTLTLHGAGIHTDHDMGDTARQRGYHVVQSRRTQRGDHRNVTGV